MAAADIISTRETIDVFHPVPFRRFLTALRAGPPFSWGVTSGGPPGGRSLSKDGTRADSAKDFCRLAGGVYYAGNPISNL